MARAKRTDRADARRRYRAAQVDTGTDEDPETDEAAGSSGGRAAAGAPTGRGGLTGLVGSIHLPDFRADAVALPALIRTTPGLWAAFLLGVVAIAAGLTFPSGDATLGLVILPLLVQPPGIPVLVGGFFAPRGAWLVGGLLGAMQTVGYVIYYGVRAPASASAATTATLDAGAVGTIFVFYIVLGAAFASLASWYRGWLRRMGARNAALRAEREKQQRRDTKRSTRPAR